MAHYVTRFGIGGRHIMPFAEGGRHTDRAQWLPPPPFSRGGDREDVACRPAHTAGRPRVCAAARRGDPVRFGSRLPEASCRHELRRGLRRRGQLEAARLRASRARTARARRSAPLAAQILEFGPNGKFMREIGKGLYDWSFAHTACASTRTTTSGPVDKGSDMVIKFNPAGPRADGLRPQEGSGRRPVPGADARAAIRRRHTWTAVPPADRRRLGLAAGNTYISDGYVNSRVAKYDKNGDWVKSWGIAGHGPGQFNTPHAIAVDRTGNVYVADRGNARIQVFDTDGKFLRQFTDRRAASRRARAGQRQHADPGARPAPALGLAVSRSASRPAPTSTCSSARHVSGTDLQDGRSTARCSASSGKPGQAASSSRADPRAGVPVGERNLRGRDLELARAEAAAQSAKNDHELAGSLRPTGRGGRRRGATCGGGP